MGKIPILPPQDNEAETASIVSLFDANPVDDFSERRQHANRRQMEDDLVTAMDVDQVFSIWQNEALHHPETGFLSRRGRDAKGMYEAFQEEAERKYLELNDGLGNENQRALFETRVQDHMQWGQDRIAAHEAREVDVHRRTSMGEASIFETRRAVERMSEGDVAGAEESMDTALRFLGQSLSGMPQDQRDEAQSMLISAYHGDVFNRQLEADPLGAAQYVFKNQKAIRPDIYERLRQTAERKIEKAEGRSLFESVYEPEAELESLYQSIDASDAPEPQKSIARELVEDQRVIEQAEQIAIAKQRIQKAEQATLSAVQMIDQGTAFDQVPDELKNQLTPEHRKAAQAIYLQKLSGDAARRNDPLELELHESWMKYVNGESEAFLELPLASQYGNHNRARLDVWIKRQAQLKRGDPRIQEEISRRKFAFNKATAFVAEAVNQRTTAPATRTTMQGHLNEAAITYINHWYETNPGQMMEPKALVDTLTVMVGTEVGDANANSNNFETNSSSHPEALDLLGGAENKKAHRNPLRRSIDTIPLTAAGNTGPIIASGTENVGRPNRIDSRDIPFDDDGNLPDEKVLDRTLGLDLWSEELLEDLKRWNGPERRSLNINLPKTGEEAQEQGFILSPEDQALFHQNNSGKREKKYTHPDGREVVFDGDTGAMITNSLLEGTYNYAHYDGTLSSFFSHFFLDVLPFLALDSSPEQRTLIVEYYLEKLFSLADK